ncbi:hypothetical protein [Brevundimonas sp.]|uniref:hypothetical protein n=1 Tax=Brevundimonas sp. TaxID=1871086 RepID=UPI0028A9824B|nr:hypothetical protein [Brevundimonas sp.]
MPHQNTTSSKATSQNAVNDPIAPNDQAREQNRSVHPEPRSYAAHDVVDSTLAGPAAGEVADYADEGEAMGMSGQQQGRNHSIRPIRTESHNGQGRKTPQANHERFGRRPQ